MLLIASTHSHTHKVPTHTANTLAQTTKGKTAKILSQFQDIFHASLCTANYPAPGCPPPCPGPLLLLPSIKHSLIPARCTRLMLNGLYCVHRALIAFQSPIHYTVFRMNFNQFSVSACDAHENHSRKIPFAHISFNAFITVMLTYSAA